MATVGYEVVNFYFSLPSVEMVVERVKFRVSVGDHNIPEDTFHRRYHHSLENLADYKQVVDSWVECESI